MTNTKLHWNAHSGGNSSAESTYICLIPRGWGIYKTDLDPVFVTLLPE